MSQSVVKAFEIEHKSSLKANRNYKLVYHHLQANLPFHAPTNKASIAANRMLRTCHTIKNRPNYSVLIKGNFLHERNGLRKL